MTYRSALRAALTAVALLAPASSLAQLGTFRARQLVEDTVVLLSRPEAVDGFGAGFAVGDFDGDGVDDLATAIPGDDYVLGIPDAGAVVVRYGVAGFGLAPGLVVDDGFLAQWWQGGPDAAEAGDHFGGWVYLGPAGWRNRGALAAGDFDGDGYDDLAIGIPLEDVGGDEVAGAVQVHYGSPSGVSNTGAWFVNQDTPGVAGETEGSDDFGWSLAAGDFDGDGYEDLAIGVPGEGLGVLGVAQGMVQVLYGGGGGLGTARARHFDQDVAYGGVPMSGDPEDLDYFGRSLATGDLNGDGYDDLAIGVPGEDDAAGAVAVVYGTAVGLATIGNQLLHQDTTGIFDGQEDDDGFGTSLAIADFTGEGFADLVVGVPYEDLDLGGGQTAADAGAIHFLFGSAAGLSGPDSYFLTESSTLAGVSETGDRWSESLSAGEFDLNGVADLAIGAPGEHVVGEGDGAVMVLYHGPGVAQYAQTWHQNVQGVPDQQEPGDRFGAALAVGDFDGSGHDDLVVGGPFESVSAQAQGAAWILYGSLFADGFELGSAVNWSAVVP